MLVMDKSKYINDDMLPYGGAYEKIMGKGERGFIWGESENEELLGGI